MFMFAICRRPSVSRLSVTFVHPTQPIEIFGNVSAPCRLVLISNRKSYMSFRLVPKSVTLNDLERRNGRYIALFH